MSLHSRLRTNLRHFGLRQKDRDLVHLRRELDPEILLDYARGSRKLIKRVAKKFELDLVGTGVAPAVVELEDTSVSRRARVLSNAVSMDSIDDEDAVDGIDEFAEEVEPLLASPPAVQRLYTEINRIVDVLKPLAVPKNTDEEHHALLSGDDQELLDAFVGNLHPQNMVSRLNRRAVLSNHPSGGAQKNELLSHKMEVLLTEIEDEFAKDNPKLRDFIREKRKHLKAFHKQAQERLLESEKDQVLTGLENMLAGVAHLEWVPKKTQKYVFPMDDGLTENYSQTIMTENRDFKKYNELLLEIRLAIPHLKKLRSPTTDSVLEPTELKDRGDVLKEYRILNKLVRDTDKLEDLLTKYAKKIEDESKRLAALAIVAELDRRNEEVDTVVTHYLDVLADKAKKTKFDKTKETISFILTTVGAVSGLLGALFLLVGIAWPPALAIGGFLSLASVGVAAIPTVTNTVREIWQMIYYKRTIRWKRVIESLATYPLLALSSVSLLLTGLGAVGVPTATAILKVSDLATHVSKGASLYGPMSMAYKLVTEVLPTIARDWNKSKDPDAAKDGSLTAVWSMFKGIGKRIYDAVSYEYAATKQPVTKADRKNHHVMSFELAREHEMRGHRQGARLYDKELKDGLSDLVEVDPDTQEVTVLTKKDDARARDVAKSYGAASNRYAYFAVDTRKNEKHPGNANDDRNYIKNTNRFEQRKFRPIVKPSLSYEIEWFILNRKKLFTGHPALEAIYQQLQNYRKLGNGADVTAQVRSEYLSRLDNLCHDFLIRPDSANYSAARIVVKQAHVLLAEELATLENLANKLTGGARIALTA